MYIAGIQKTTLLDYPGKVACTLFLRGCNLRCPFCQNGGLVLPERMDESRISLSELEKFLKKRRGILEGVCITGGEPTIYGDLPELILRIRQLGYPVKLDTNGSHPDMLGALLEEKLLSYVAVDIKNCPERYGEICGGIDILPQVRQTVDILLNCGIPYEFRTTLSHPYHDEMAMESIGRWIAGARAYYLQAFREEGDLVGSGCTAMTDEEIYTLQRVAKKYVPDTYIRGIQ